MMKLKSSGLTLCILITNIIRKIIQGDTVQQYKLEIILLKFKPLIKK